VKWPSAFEDLLIEWNHLRQDCQRMPLPDAMLCINDWWWRAPTYGPALTWDDINDWPNPWELLERPGWCDLAKALGMLYTVMLLESQDIDSVVLMDTDQGNLVQVNQGIYILNWSPGKVVNIQSSIAVIKRSVSSAKFTKKIG
jgi:hypothetical protein